MKTSLARKFVMGLTGLFLISFILIHLLVNSFSLISGELFNEGSHFMATNPLIQIMQYVLALGFILHIGMGIKLTLQNNAARGIKYAKNNAAANSGVSSRSMIITGMLVLLFLILHIKDFFIVIKFQDLGGFATDFDLMLNVFSNPVYVAVYVIAFIALGIHLNHGFQSAFQTMGINHSRYNGLIKAAGVAVAVIIAVGFSAIAIFHFLAQ